MFKLYVFSIISLFVVLLAVSLANHQKEEERNQERMKWNFRPSAFNSVTKYADLSYGTLINQYKRDNKRAREEGVTILPRSSDCQIRTLQWNVHGWRNAYSETSSEITNGITQTIVEADADVIVLNEYHFGDDQNEGFEEKLQHKGYTTFRCGTVDFPTAVATRLEVFESREIMLGQGRSAILFLVTTTNTGNAADFDNNNDEEPGKVWIIGTHLDHHDAGLRKNQTKALLIGLGKLENDYTLMSNSNKALLLGDFNQQRQEDYSRSEWNQILDSMTKRRSSKDDNVSRVLNKAGFICAWDGLLSLPDDTCSTSSNKNWDTSKPPSTHWSGSIVDYSYGKNMDPLKVSISPAGWSDHRMTVCDWRLSS